MSKSKKSEGAGNSKVPLTSKAPPKVQGPIRVREIAEMVDELEVQLKLLEEHTERAYVRKEFRYWGEAATKLRLLVLTSGGTRGLMFKVGEAFGADMIVTVPPDLIARANNPTGDMHFEKTFDRIAYMRRGDDGPVYVSERELIKIWSEKRGGSHSDWKEDAWIDNMFTFHGITFDGATAAEVVMNRVANQTLHFGRELLGHARRWMVEDGAAASTAPLQTP